LFDAISSRRFDCNCRVLKRKQLSFPNTNQQILLINVRKTE